MAKKVLFEVRERSEDPAFQIVEDDNGVIQIHYGATYASEANLRVGVTAQTINGATVLMGAGGATILRGPLADGVWATIPSIFRLRLTGTGTVVIDSKDSLGNITTGVASYTVSGATDQIEFPYAGDNAVAIRATLTGTTAEVI